MASKDKIVDFNKEKEKKEKKEKQEYIADKRLNNLGLEFKNGKLVRKDD